MIADCSVLAIIAPSLSRCPAFLDAWRYNKIVDWSIVRSYGEYAALVCRHGKRKGILFRFSYFFWGEVLQVFQDSCAGYSPSNRKIGLGTYSVRYA